MGKFDAPCLFDPALSGLDETLTELLTPVIDCARDVHARLGAAPYQVTLVWEVWSGGERNYGQPAIAQTLRLLPPPTVHPESCSASVEQPCLSESGSLLLTEISPRYTEHVLSGRDLVVDAGEPLPSSYDFWYEIEYHQPGQPVPAHRRYTMVGPPVKVTKSAGWQVRLQRSLAPGRLPEYRP